MNTINKKYDVLNPIILFNTIGEELHEIFTENNYSLDILNNLNIDKQSFKTKERFAKKELKDICTKIENPDLYSYFINFQDQYKTHKINSDLEFKILNKIYSKVKHISFLLGDEFNDGVDKLEDISNFLEIDNEKNIFQTIDKNIALYKISNFQPDNFNLFAWLKKGEHDFKKIPLPSYNKEGLLSWINERDWKEHLNESDYFMNLPKILEEFGVGLVYTPYLEKTVFGCVRWFEDKPLIQLSDKGKNLANFWYVLFHELGHVIKHEKDEIFEGNDISQAQMNKKEKEANSFANDYLFNGDSLRRFIFLNRKTPIDNNFINDTSEKFKVDPMFTALWGLKAQLKGINLYRYMPQLTF